MSVESIGLILIVGFLLWQWRGSLKKIRPDHHKMPRIQLVSKETGEVLEMRVVETIPPVKREISENDFLKTAQSMFRKICEDFAAARKKELKNMLSPAVYQIFCHEIDKRVKQHQQIEFSFVCFASVKILEKTKGWGRVTVEFVSEQINLLKDGAGAVIEGDPMHIARVSDIWTFKKKGRSNWVVVATKQGVTNASA